MFNELGILEISVGTLIGVIYGFFLIRFLNRQSWLTAGHARLYLINLPGLSLTIAVISGAILFHSELYLRLVRALSLP